MARYIAKVLGLALILWIIVSVIADPSIITDSHYSAISVFIASVLYCIPEFKESR